MTFEYVPTLQFAHTNTLVAATVTENLPATHFVHTESVVAPTVPEYVPAVQLGQPALPVTLLYFPEAQVVHCCPFGPVYPALQAQSFMVIHGLQ